MQNYLMIYTIVNNVTVIQWNLAALQHFLWQCRCAIDLDALNFLCVVVDGSEFLAKESNELFWSFIEELAQLDLESPECE